MATTRHGASRGAACQQRAVVSAQAATAGGYGDVRVSTAWWLLVAGLRRVEQRKWPSRPAGGERPALSPVDVAGGTVLAGLVAGDRVVVGPGREVANHERFVLRETDGGLV